MRRVIYGKIILHKKRELPSTAHSEFLKGCLSDCISYLVLFDLQIYTQINITSRYTTYYALLTSIPNLLVQTPSTFSTHPSRGVIHAEGTCMMILTPEMLAIYPVLDPAESIMTLEPLIIPASATLLALQNLLNGFLFR